MFTIYIYFLYSKEINNVIQERKTCCSVEKTHTPKELFNNAVKQMKCDIPPSSLGCFINSFIISLFVLKYTLLPALVCFPPACCLSCPKLFHLPLISLPSRGAFHYTNVVSLARVSSSCIAPHVKMRCEHGGAKDAKSLVL